MAEMDGDVLLAALQAAEAAAQVPLWRHIADYYGRANPIPAGP